MKIKLNSTEDLLYSTVNIMLAEETLTKYVHWEKRTHFNKIKISIKD